MDQLLIGEVFANAARAVPHRTAAVLGDRSLTFGRLDALADRTAAGLQARGVRPGDRVACWARTGLDVVVLFAALAKAGAVFVPIAGTLGGTEAAQVAAAMRPSLVAVGGDRPVADTTLLAAATGSRTVRLGSLVGSGAPDRPAPRVPGAAAPPGPSAETDPHVIFPSSGSTGRPKGVVLSHRASFLRSHPGSQLEPRGAAVCTFPLFHMAAWTISLQQWQARAAVVYVERPRGEAIREAVSAHGATRLYCIPAVWQRVLDAGGTPLSTLRFADTGTSSVTPGLLAAIGSVAPRADVRVFYGSTEAGNVACLAGDDVAKHPRSVGPPGTSVRVHVTGTGELHVRGPLLFDGYFDDPGATEAAFTDGWYRTGDLADIDAEGRLTIVGRVGDVIRTGGETVVPVEVEQALAGHPAVADVAVIGLPDPVWGEVVCCVIVPRYPASPPGLDELRAFLHDRLAAHKHPRRLRLVATLPRTAATGQLRRHQIRDSV
ncbi:acyl--CoA ligase [Streptomyces bambusae]|uniref:class I adenylate-forming enzyme family protein n=1 Tax=Streptomyces bambusae TaxID=1550616 RepID=UPI001CFE6009|nr:class I adenylate-forming enzyme family protein [Streptomyces bambusae]MCB5164713.1 acyl--CoA ligase [Streptomyces bambusae]